MHGRHGAQPAEFSVMVLAYAAPPSRRSDMAPCALATKCVAVPLVAAMRSEPLCAKLLVVVTLVPMAVRVVWYKRPLLLIWAVGSPIATERSAETAAAMVAVAAMAARVVHETNAARIVVVLVRDVWVVVGVVNLTLWVMSAILREVVRVVVVVPAVAEGESLAKVLRDKAGEEMDLAMLAGSEVAAKVLRVVACEVVEVMVVDVVVVGVVAMVVIVVR